MRDNIKVLTPEEKERKRLKKVLEEDLKKLDKIALDLHVGTRYCLTCGDQTLV